MLLLACNLMLVLQPQPQSQPLPPASSKPTEITPVDVVDLPSISQSTSVSGEVSTVTASPVPTQAWIIRGPDSVEVPILLYHRIAVSEDNSRYYVTPERFREQVTLLHDWGYTSIGIELLATALRMGAPLPPRPIIITFDDGNLDNYQSAFPLMRQAGLTGVIFIVGKYLGAPGFMDATLIREMADAGWEVGSHGMTHQDLLALNEEDQQYELRESRRFLQDRLGLPILSFAYPFGSMDPGLATAVYNAGYLAAVGTIGSTSIQDSDHLFHLRRHEVLGQEGLSSFSSFLPWQAE